MISNLMIRNLTNPMNYEYDLSHNIHSKFETLKIALSSTPIRVGNPVFDFFRDHKKIFNFQTRKMSSGSSNSRDSWEFLTEAQINEILTEVPNPPGAGNTMIDIARTQIIKMFRDYLEDPAAEIKLPPSEEAFLEFKAGAIESLYKAFIEVGTTLGVRAATALSGPLTQMTLNTFHFAGQQSGVAAAFNLVRDFLTGTKTDRNPSMRIFLKDPTTGTDLHDVVHVGTTVSIYEMRSDLEQTTVDDVVATTQTLNRQEALNEDVPLAMAIAARLRPDRFQGADFRFPMTYVLLLDLNLYRMKTRNINMMELAQSIEGPSVPGHPNAITCVWKSQLEGKMYVLVDELRDYGIKLATPQTAIQMFIDQQIIPTMSKWIIKGIPGIVALEPREVNVLSSIDRIQYMIDGQRKNITGRIPRGPTGGQQIVIISQKKTRLEGASLYDVYLLFLVAGFQILLVNKEQLEIVIQNNPPSVEKQTEMIRRADLIIHSLNDGLFTVGLPADDLTKAGFTILGAAGPKTLLIEGDPNKVPSQYEVISKEGDRITIKYDNLKDLRDRVRAIGFKVQNVNETTIVIRYDSGNVLIDLQNYITSARNSKSDSNEFPQTDQDRRILSRAAFSYIVTNGSNFEPIAWRDDVDLYRSYPSKSHEISEILGIDAARTFLIEEFTRTLEDFSSYINVRHIGLMFDLFTNLGVVNSMTHAGVNRRALGPLAAASHQRAMDVFTNSSIFGDKNKILGQSAAMYVGQQASGMGTAAFGTVSDETNIPRDRPELPPSDQILEGDLFGIEENFEGTGFAALIAEEETEIEKSILASYSGAPVDKTNITRTATIVDKPPIDMSGIIDVPTGATIIYNPVLQKALNKVTTGTNFELEIVQPRPQAQQVPRVVISEKLLTEYQRWNSVNHVVTQFSTGMSGRDVYEFRNILERFFLSRDNRVPNYEEKMASELREKKINIQPGNIIAFLYERYPSTINDNRVIRNPGQVKFNDFILNYKIQNGDRIDYLFNYQQATEADVMMMLLRYSSAIDGGQQWGIPSTVANVLLQYGIRNEGFASPLNSRFISGGRYCSLYPDTDTVFGSLGSVFQVDFNQYDGGWEVNPPFVESIINDTSRKILQTVEASQGHKQFFVVLPNWTGLTGLELLLNSQWLRHTKVWNRDQAFFMTWDGNMIPNKFSTIYLVIGGQIQDGFISALESAWTSNLGQNVAPVEQVQNITEIDLTGLELMSPPRTRPISDRPFDVLGTLTTPVSSVIIETPTAAGPQESMTIVPQVIPSVPIVTRKSKITKTPNPIPKATIISASVPQPEPAPQLTVPDQPQTSTTSTFDFASFISELPPAQTGATSNVNVGVPLINYNSLSTMLDQLKQSKK